MVDTINTAIRLMCKAHKAGRLGITGEADPERGSLDGALTIALLVAIQEVNDLGKTSSSAPKTNSGASSSSTASAAAPSPKRVRRSPSKSRSSGQNTGNATEA